MGKIFYQVLRPISNIIIDIVYKPKIYNKQLMPKKDAIIFAGNHLTDMDQIVVIRATKRTVRFLTKKELYHGLLGFVLKLYDTIPVDRNNKDNNSAMEISEKALQKGDAINIFPEGTKNKTNDILLPFKYGAVSLAKKTRMLYSTFWH